jgi:hypothetical protein
MTSEASHLLRLIALAIGGCTLSYLVFTVNTGSGSALSLLSSRSRSIGLYQLYRLLQFFVVLLVSTRTNFDSNRCAQLRSIVGLTLAISSLLLFADYLDLVGTSFFAGHISRDLVVSGPWAFYARGIIGRPVGTLSYHHAYPAIQLLLLTSLYLYLLPPTGTLRRTVAIAVLVAFGFVSSSRAGFAAICLFGALMVLRKPRYIIAALFLLVGLLAASFDSSGRLRDLLSDAAERQASIAYSYAEDGWSGRSEIWADRLEVLRQNRMSWLVGMGFGAAVETGANAHMLYLHLISELGLVGLFGFLFLVGFILRSLWRCEEPDKILCFATMGFLLTAISQETFYPLPAFGHFTGLFLAVVGIALRPAAVCAAR